MSSLRQSASKKARPLTKNQEAANQLFQLLYKLQMTEDERKVLRSVVDKNKRQRKASTAEANKPKLDTLSPQERKAALRVDQKNMKTIQKKMDQERDEKVQQTHKVSRYSDFVRIAPGSFSSKSK